MNGEWKGAVRVLTKAPPLDCVPAVCAALQQQQEPPGKEIIIEQPPNPEVI